MNGSKTIECNIIAALITLCILMLIPSYAYLNEKCEQIEIRNFNKSYELGLEDLNDRDSLTTYLLLSLPMMNDKYCDEVLSKADMYLSENGYDPILTSVYLSIMLNNNNTEYEKILPLLLKYHRNEPYNSIPSYYLSYYYLLEGNNDLAVKYLIEGNKKNRYERHLYEKRDLVFELLLSKTNDEDISYSASPAVYMLDYKYRPYVNKLLDITDDYDIIDELVELGERIESDNKSGINVLLGLGILSQIAKQEDDNELMESVAKKRENVNKILKRIEPILEDEEIRRFIRLYYEYGEIYALENFEYSHIDDSNNHDE